ncbi:MAG: rhodanese-like domain-containing protein [Myxococcota bacterium]
MSLSTPLRVPLSGCLAGRVDALRGRVRIVDVREPHEFRGELGHIPEAELAPLGRLSEHAPRWDREAEIVVVCRSGGRSGAAADALARQGFKRVKNLVGGMLRWHGEGRATSR